MSPSQDQQPESSDAHAPQEPPFDPAGLLDQVGGDLQLARELVNVFREDCPKLLRKVRESVERQDASALERAAHSLKGAAVNFRAKRVVAAASLLEEKGRENRLADAERVYASLEQEAKRLDSELAAFAENDR